ncbi:MAG: hypothetical protein BMS9Abin23_0382 [Thermodesulfobacteriota bacterium]|nr:MAG: hypothetical protein BMS9Abin23_0382 [Thermodesulfobacteriota bacterium]
MRKVFLLFLMTVFILTGSYAGAESTVGKILDQVKVKGFVSAGYNYNFNTPDSKAINFRPFNNKDNSFNLELAGLVFEKEASAPGDAGFRIDLDYGFTIPEQIRSTGLSLESDQFDLRQAYVRWVAPVGNGLTLDFGKFITEMGAEVIEGADGWNYNYSRSLLFYYTIPFTHTGLRASYTPNDYVSFVAAVVNGWDNVVDNNSAKSFLIHAAITPTKTTTVNLKYIVGAERDDNNRDLRHVVNVNFTQEFLEKFTFNLDLVYGSEDSAVVVNETATWSGVSGIIRYAVNDMIALNLRGEFLDDNDGSRTGTKQQMWEFTFTPEFAVSKNIIIRPEYRHDASDSKVFDKDNILADSKTQDTVGINVLFYF